MLGKLLKYEFKATSRLLGLIYLVVLAVAAVTGILGRSNIMSLSDQNGIVFGIFTMIYIILIVAMIIITLFLIVERFYKNMLQGEGYLMHTLPVPTWMHVASKTISAFVWEVLAVAVLILSLVLVVTTGGAWKELCEIFNGRFWEAIIQNAALVVVFIICLFVQLIRIVLMFYASMSIGASSTRHKIFFSILAFVVIMIVVNVISMVTNLGMVTNLIISAEDYAYSVKLAPEMFMTKIFVKQIIIDAVYSVIFFVITNFFLKRKLNLE